jgi:hypothetical protein
MSVSLIRSTRASPEDKWPPPGRRGAPHFENLCIKGRTPIVFEDNLLRIFIPQKDEVIRSQRNCPMRSSII